MDTMKKLYSDAAAFGRGARSNTIPFFFGGPVDLISAGLGAVGVNTGSAPVGGSAWITQQLRRAGMIPDDMTGDPLETFGGLVGGAMAPSAARQAGRAAFAAEQNAAAPRTASATPAGRQIGAVGPMDRQTAAKIHQAIQQPDGGATIDLFGNSPNGGFAVASNPAKAMVAPAQNLQPDDIAQWIDKNRSALGRPNTYVGAWHSPDTKQVYLEPSMVVPDKGRALAMGEAIPNQKGKIGSQEAVFDLNTFNSVPVKPPKLGPRAQELGNRIQSAPVQRALDEAFERGMDINQKNFGGRDWWPVTGTEIERVLGPKLAQVWQDHFAMAAPGMQVPSNITAANKATAQLIRGKPYENISFPTVNTTFKNYGEGKYFDKNRMASSPKITEMMFAGYADAPVIDDLRFGQGLFGLDKLNRSEHAVAREEFARRAGSYNAKTGNTMPTAEYTARAWQGVRPDAPLAQQAPAEDAYRDALVRRTKMTPKELNDRFGLPANRKLTYEEVVDLIRRGLIWGGAGAAALPSQDAAASGPTSTR